MVINRWDSQTAHGGEEHGTMEGTDLQQEPGEHAEIIQGFQKPHREFQQHTGNQGQGMGGIVKAGIQGCVLDLFHLNVHLVIDILCGIPESQMYLDDRVGRGRIHFLLDGHTELNVITTGVHLLTGDKPVQPGISGQCPAVACQENMGQAEIGQTFPPLLTDVAVEIADLKSFREVVGGSIPGHHDVRNHLGHRG